MHGRKKRKVEEGVRFTLEARWRVEEEDLGLKAEEERLKSEAEDQARLKAEEEDKYLRKKGLNQRRISAHG